MSDSKDNIVCEWCKKPVRKDCPWDDSPDMQYNPDFHQQILCEKCFVDYMDKNGCSKCKNHTCEKNPDDCWFNPWPTIVYESWIGERIE